MVKSPKQIMKVFLTDAKFISMAIRQINLKGEALHQARIKTRRLLAILDLLSFAFDDTEAARAVKVLDVFLNQTNFIRDYEVAQKIIKNHALGFRLPRFKTPEMKILSPHNFDGLEKNILELNEKDIHVYLRHQLRRLRNKIRHSKKEPLGKQTLHKIRIRIKKCRYLLDVAFRTKENVIKSFLKNAIKMQTTLGKTHDTEITFKLIKKTFPNKSSARKALKKLQKKRVAQALEALPQMKESAERLRKQK